MKRSVFLAVILMLLMSVGSVTFAQSIDADLSDIETTDASLFSYEIKDDGTAVITGIQSRYKGNLIIPSKIDGYEVTEIGKQAFFFGKNIFSVIIPEGVTTISYGAFWECENLSYVKLPDSLEKIEEEVFNNCKQLNEITVPGSVRKISGGVFSGCENLCSITIEEGVVDIGYYAFSRCSNLEYIELPNTVETIETNAFGECTSLKAIKLSENLRILESEVFVNCAELNSVIMPKCETTAGHRCFAGCENLTVYGYLNSDVHLMSGEWGYNFVPVDVCDDDRVGGFIDENFIWSLDRQTGNLAVLIYGAMPDFEVGEAPWYEYRDEITQLTLDGNFDNISENAFYGCALKEVELPVEINAVESTSFAGCDALEKITVTNISCRLPNDMQIGNALIEGFSHSTAETFAAENNYEFALAEQEHSHTWNEKVSKALSIKDGYYYKVCSICGEDESYIIKKPVITLPKSEVVYNGKQQKPVFVIKDEQGNVIKGVKYSLSLIKGDNYGGAGKKTVGVSLSDLYNAYEEFQYTIKKKNISGYSVTVKPFASSYMGIPIEATVKVNGLVEGADYGVRFENNQNAGKASVIITGRNNHTGTIKKTFTIKRSIYCDELKIKVVKDAYEYDGKAKKIVFDITDHGGNKMKEGVDYRVEYSSKNRTKIGQNTVKIVFIRNYKGAIGEHLYSLKILPKKPGWVKADLRNVDGGYDDVYLRWGKAKYAKGYVVQYKKASDKTYKKYTATTGTSVKINNLADGSKYSFRVMPYTKGKYRDQLYSPAVSVIAEVVTLKKVAKPNVVKNGTKVKVSWNNINGETGYQISRSSKQGGTYVVSTVKTTTGKSSTVKAPKGKTYYYKVRAYKVVNGKKVFAPWSEPYKFVRK